MHFPLICFFFFILICTRVAPYIKVGRQHNIPSTPKDGSHGKVSHFSVLCVIVVETSFRAIICTFLFLCRLKHRRSCFFMQQFCSPPTHFSSVLLVSSLCSLFDFAHWNIIFHSKPCFLALPLALSVSFPPPPVLVKADSPVRDLGCL